MLWRHVYFFSEFSNSISGMVGLNSQLFCAVQKFNKHAADSHKLREKKGAMCYFVPTHCLKHGKCGV
jgi:hypothetical protein